MRAIDYAHIAKAYAEGQTTVVEFVPSEQLDPIMFDRS